MAVGLTIAGAALSAQKAWTFRPPMCGIMRSNMQDAMRHPLLAALLLCCPAMCLNCPASVAPLPTASTAAIAVKVSNQDFACHGSACYASVELAQAGGQLPADSSPPAPEEFSVATAKDLVSSLREGLVGMDQQQTMSVFDPGMPGYSELNGQIASIFSRYDNVRVYARVIQAGDEGGRNTATVDFTMEALPPDIGRPPVRRSQALELRFARGTGGWKIVGFEPRSFFAAF
jgi:hypothetical protein